jgi:tetratricopeptide (TPR) repeat protein
MIVILDNASHRHDIDELCRKILAVLLDKPYGSLKPPIGEVIRTDIVRSRAARAVEHYRQLKKDDPASVDFSESELNTLGYRLMEAGRVSDAVQIMQLNVEAFPSSANAYDSLGEAYLANHQNALAKDSYAKSLELNPQSDNARAVLAKLAH